jgi:xylose isomerase-like TIM barrel protein
MLQRRDFLNQLAATAAAAALPSLDRVRDKAFAVSVITDEISQDLGRACEIAAREFGLGWVELRSAWDTNIMSWDVNQIAEARRVIDRFNLRVSNLASPIFKCDWPDAPQSRFSPKAPQFGADFPYAQQDELLARVVGLAATFKTSLVRIFDFWRLDDQTHYRESIDSRLRAATLSVKAKGITLMLENEAGCNTATGAESARLLAAVPDLTLNWDPGNARAAGETPYPGGYARLPTRRIAHVHCKDVVVKPDGSTDWAAMGSGIVDWLGQFRALRRDGFDGTLSLETHWRGAGSAEESSRRSMAGMKALLARAEATAPASR